MNNREITIIRSSRKTLGIQITPDGELVVRAPRGLPRREIERFLQEKAAWIDKSIARAQSAKQAGEAAPLSAQDIRALKQNAMEVIPLRVEAFAQRMRVTYGCITIRSQTGRWGSCSNTGSLSFNCLLMLAPETVLDYVIVHELSHRVHMNHSAAFWQTVASVLPEYKKEEAWLKTQGRVLLARVRSGKEKS